LLRPHLEPQGPRFTNTVVQSIAHILSRPLPDRQAIETASRNLENIEDTLWLSSEPEQTAGYLKSFGGATERPSQRKRSELEGPEGPAPCHPRQDIGNTTMSNSSNFSIATTTLSRGFISASTLRVSEGSR